MRTERIPLFWQDILSELEVVMMRAVGLLFFGIELVSAGTAYRYPAFMQIAIDVLCFAIGVQLLLAALGYTDVYRILWIHPDISMVGIMSASFVFASTNQHLMNGIAMIFGIFLFFTFICRNSFLESP